ncbi:excalibur calcium-binding domain-containing protein [Comamonas sp.]|uniref:excalibur calcium-binding domain-containing protein n=1 Tax=Comamonas sp. TaxID=34028 RepID=UPI00289DAEB2|nr:excalibur calcium-binding domain-containing protein [Comamonas sp.]
MGAITLSQAWAHGGGLNAEGCHTNRKTGDYHCHRASSHAPTVNSRSLAATAPSKKSRPTTTDVRMGAFANCAAARAAGAAPVYRGDPGYGPHLDRDNDGVGCEPSARRRR